MRFGAAGALNHTLGQDAAPAQRFCYYATLQSPQQPLEPVRVARHGAPSGEWLALARALTGGHRHRHRNATCYLAVQSK